jgi:hypothetical protein
MHMPMRAVFFVAVGGGAWFEQKPAAGEQRRRGGRGGTPRMQRKAYGTGGRCVEVIHDTEDPLPSLFSSPLSPSALLSFFPPLLPPLLPSAFPSCLLSSSSFTPPPLSPSLPLSHLLAFSPSFPLSFHLSSPSALPSFLFFLLSYYPARLCGHYSSSSTLRCGTPDRLSWSCTPDRLVFFLYSSSSSFLILFSSTRSWCTSRVRVVILHARSRHLPSSSTLILHTRAPRKRRKKRKREKRGGCGGLAPHSQALFASLSDDTTKPLPHRDAKARHRLLPLFCFVICSTS